MQKKGQVMNINFYYQIDFIDDAELANYIDTFKQNELEKAKEHYRTLSNALSCTKGTNQNMRYVLDMYAYIQDKDEELDETDVLVAQILPELELKV